MVSTRGRIDRPPLHSLRRISHHVDVPRINPSLLHTHSVLALSLLAVRTFARQRTGSIMRWLLSKPYAERVELQSVHPFETLSFPQHSVVETKRSVTRTQPTLASVFPTECSQQCIEGAQRQLFNHVTLEVTVPQSSRRFTFGNDVQSSRAS